MQLALIVSGIVIGAVIIVGVLGHLIDKNAEPAEQKADGKGAWR